MKFKQFLEKYNVEVPVLLTAFLFALAGDLLYGGVEGASSYLVGSLLESASYLFFTIFTIVVLFRLITSFFVSDKFYHLCSRLPDNSDTVIKPMPKKQ